MSKLRRNSRALLALRHDGMKRTSVSEVEIKCDAKK